MEQVIEIEGLRKSYGRFRLRDISFALPRGYITGMIGPNGAGKTTVIKLIMNLIRKESGSIRVFGMDHILREVEVKARIGFVYEAPMYYEDLSLKTLARSIAPFYDKWNQPAFLEYMERFELPPGKRFGSLSKGMKMKFAIAVALSHDAELLIMDEPTAGLDPVFRREFLDILRGLMQDENKSVLFSTHITSDLERVADHLVFIQNGGIVFSSSKDEILDSWGIVKAAKDFIDEGNRYLFKGARKHDYVFEALTCDVEQARRLINSDALIEKASLEDIMVFIDRGMPHA
jgi:ABC-2 type transport system ATP-binding protein